MRIAIATALSLCACAAPQGSHEDSPETTSPSISTELPRGYVAYRTPAPLMIDGRLDEAAWAASAWTEDFRDIQGEGHPIPWFRTRAKMLWDDTYFYVAAELEEPHVWATLTQRDSIIFHDNDFEVFIDPDGDTHEYYELETNAYGTDWDLFLVKPYRDGGPALHGWDIAGLLTEVSIDGTINDPTNTDRGWTIEIAIPWAALKEAAHRPSPPEPGDVWRVNYSRVEWNVHVEDGRYVKDVDPKTGRTKPEENWVWSPQGVINMHCPETWGLVQFSGVVAGAGHEALVRPDDLDERACLRAIYFRLRELHAEHGDYCEDLGAGLEDAEARGFPVSMQATPDTFEVTLPLEDGSRLYIRQNGKIWRTEK